MKKKIFILMTTLLFLSACTSKPISRDENIFYQIFVGSFADSNGDQIGDLNGISEKLDYLNEELGVNSIWLTPIHPSPSYHKYDVIDYFAIDPQFGTLEDFEKLIEQAHKKDMRIIIDLVLNHTSSEHPWFKEAVRAKQQNTCDTSIYCDYYNFSTKPEHGYEKLSDGIYYEAVFWSGMPDLNLENPAVKDEIEKISQFWIEKGVDGFRLDATSHFFENKTKENTEFLAWFTDMVKDKNDAIHIVGEAWVPLGTRLSLYESGIDSFFNFEFSQQDSEIIKKINKEQGNALANLVNRNQQTLQKINSKAKDSFFLSNHDQGRSAAYFGNDFEKQKLSATVLAFLPGDVYIYYGEELGMLGSGIDENKRLPMLWGTYDLNAMTKRVEGADYKDYELDDVKQQLKDKDSLLNHYKKILSLRNKYPFIADVPSKVIDLDNDALYALEHEDMVVIHNFSKEVQEAEISGKIIDKVSKKSKIKNNKLSIDPYGSVIVKRNR